MVVVAAAVVGDVGGCFCCCRLCRILSLSLWSSWSLSSSLVAILVVSIFCEVVGAEGFDRRKVRVWHSVFAFDSMAHHKIASRI